MRRSNATFSILWAALRLLEQQEARRVAFTEMLERVEREADEKGWHAVAA